MLWIIILGISMVILTVYLWYLEAHPYIKRLKCVKHTGATGIFSFISTVFMNSALFIRYGIPLMLDMVFTLFLVKNLGMSGGIAGGIVGLALSNGVSLIILNASRGKV